MARDILPRRNPHSCSGTCAALEQAFELQSHESLGNRQKTHAEFGCKLTPRYRLADGHFASQDSLPHGQIGFARQAARFVDF